MKSVLKLASWLRGGGSFVLSLKMRKQLYCVWILTLKLLALKCCLVVIWGDGVSEIATAIGPVLIWQGLGLETYILQGGLLLDRGVYIFIQFQLRVGKTGNDLFSPQHFIRDNFKHRQKRECSDESPHPSSTVIST